MKTFLCISALLVGLLVRSGTVHATPPDSLLRHQLSLLLRHEVKASQPGVSVLVARGGKIIYRDAQGLAQVELGVSITPQQVFRIGSLTKTLTAATVLRLVAAGQLQLNDPLARFLPAYPNAAAITLRQLLSHTAGISDQWEASLTEEYTTAQLVALIARQPPDFSPGTAYRYSNAGYMLLGAVLEAATGQPWPEVVRHQLLAPLGMSHTGLYPPTQVVPGRVSGYSQDSTATVTLAPYASSAGPGAAGALWSTTEDLHRFLRALTSGQLLPAALYQAMATPQLVAEAGAAGYGYGLMLGTVRGVPVLEHNGGIEGFTAHFAYFPQQDVTVITLANTDAGQPNPRSLAHRLGALAIGHPYPDLQEVALSGPALAGLAGTYRLGPAATRTLFVRGQQLFARRDHGPARQLGTAANDYLYFAHDKTDLLHLVRNQRGQVVALDFCPDGLAPTRREQRTP